MRALIFIAGVLVCILGFLAFKKPEDFPLLQGGLTLGGGLIICGLFSLRSKWHGIAGAGILAMLGASRGLPGLASLAGGDPSAPFLAATGVICLVVFIAVVRVLLAERTRQAVEKMKTAGERESSLR